MRFFLMCFLAALAVCAFIRAEEKRELSVFAAASLTESFTELGKAFEAAHPGVIVSFSFAASNQLRTQIAHGAKADVFASANTKEMVSAVNFKSVNADAVQTFARNRLVVIVPKSNPGKVATLADLAKPGLKLIVADAAVPVGQYALDMIDKLAADEKYGAAFKAGAIKNIVSQEDSVKAVVAKVRLGAADAGVAYVSDVTPAAAKEISAIDVPDAFNQSATYPIAPLAKAPHPQLAREFVALVVSDEGQTVLAKYGFLRRDADKEHKQR